MIKTIKLTPDNKFECYVNIREQFKEISFPEDISLATLPEGYALAEEEDFVFNENVSQTYASEPVFENNKWIIKVIETPIVDLPFKVTEVTMRQARLQLLELGLLDEVEAMVSQDRKNQIEWEYSSTVERNSNLIDAIKILLNLSDEQIDKMFEDASKL